MDHNGSSFLTCAAPTVGFIFLAKELDALSKAGTPNSAFFVYDADDTEEAFRKYEQDVHWPAISMATIKPEGGDRVVVAIGHNGNFWEVTPATAVETVGKLRHDVVLRRLAAVGDSIFACGMNRVVLERISVGEWSSVGPSANDSAVVSFEAIAGFDSRELYAVGWRGELWWRDDGTWKRVESTTTANLNAVTCAADGFVYVAGHDGVLLKGRRDQWQRTTTMTRDDLRGVATFDGKVHVITDSAIDEIPLEQPLQLLSTRDGLIVLCRKQIFVGHGFNLRPIAH